MTQHVPSDQTVVTLEFNHSTRTLAVKSQVNDYCFRGRILDDYSVAAFFKDTYDTSKPIHDNSSTLPSELCARSHVAYLDQHPNATSRCRLIRLHGHNNLPNFVGRRFPRRDDTDVHNFYCASMLMLLKPWRDISTDLKLPEQTWSDAFDQFMQTANEPTKRILSGIQYYHECRSASDDRRESENEPSLPFLSDDDTHTSHTHASESDDESSDDDTEVLSQASDDSDREYTQQDIDELLASQLSPLENAYATDAVLHAEDARIFAATDNEFWTPALNVSLPTHVRIACGNDLRQLQLWTAQMEQEINSQDPSSDNTNTIHQSAQPDFGTVDQVVFDPSDIGSIVVGSTSHGPETALSALDVSQLNEEQHRAYSILDWHLRETVANKKPPPLRMILCGEGGTGKSKVIQTITDCFALRHCKYMLIKSAYTGIAASLIDGKTTHTIAKINVNGRTTLSDEMKMKLADFWRHYQYLVIDEYSMISRKFLADISRHISAAKVPSSPDTFSDMPGETTSSFGGISVLLCGDLHQFPPVAQAANSALYWPVSTYDTPDMRLGRLLYEDFNKVVILRKQMRVRDSVWTDFLRALRFGRVTSSHVAMLRSLIISPDPQHPSYVDFSQPPWCEAALVTPRHSVRMKWNSRALRSHCRHTNQQVFMCDAEHSTHGRTLSVTEKYSVLSQEDRRRKRTGLPLRVEFAVGMKVMVTTNIATDLDITNGARGEIVDIVLHPQEPPISTTAPVVRLKHLPAFILVKLQRTRASKLQGLDDAVIPIQPATQRIRVNLNLNKRTRTTQRRPHATKTVIRRQLPITAAYAFTDYRSQGQTIPYVVVDITSPPTGSPLSLFNIYVALSRSSGRETIRILRDFDDSIFYKSHDANLLAEDDRLEHLDSVTKTWWNDMNL